MPKRALRFVVIFAWTCGLVIGGVVTFTALAVFTPRIVREVVVQPAKPAAAAPEDRPKKFAHVKGYERDSKRREGVKP